MARANEIRLQKKKMKNTASMNDIFDNLKAQELQLLENHTNYYTNLAMSLYEWENLPNGIESRYIERALFESGQAFFYDHQDLGYIVLPCNNSSNLNIYGEPIQVMVTSYGTGFSENVDVDKGIRILNNVNAIPTINTINYYCMKLTQIDSTMNTNLIQQKVPFIFATTKANELSMKTIYQKMYSGEPAIFVNQELISGDKLNVEVKSCEAPYLLDKLQQQRYEIQKELLTFLGINNTIEKKERLLVDETNANNQQIDMSVEIGLELREQACQQINDRFGLNISVKSKVRDVRKQIEWGMEDGSLYNDDLRDEE